MPHWLRQFTIPLVTLRSCRLLAFSLPAERYDAVNQKCCPQGEGAVVPGDAMLCECVEHMQGEQRQAQVHYTAVTSLMHTHCSILCGGAEESVLLSDSKRWNLPTTSRPGRGRPVLPDR